MTAAPGDDGVPNVARIYDYYLGGSHNFAADREQAEKVLAARPNTADSARANRAFLRHAVERFLDRGIRQFLDLGSGIPTAGNVHEIAHRRDPSARIAYVDNEPVAVAHSRSILTDVGLATVTSEDLRRPEAVLAAPGVAGLFDLDRPVAVLAIASFHFVRDADGPASVLAGYRRALAAGSAFAVTHGSADFPGHPDQEQAMREVAELYASTSNPVVLRSRDEIHELLTEAGLVPDADGLVELSRWANPPQESPVGAYGVLSEPLRAAAR